MNHETRMELTRHPPFFLAGRRHASSGNGPALQNRVHSQRSFEELLRAGLRMAIHPHHHNEHHDENRCNRFSIRGIYQGRVGQDGTRCLCGPHRDHPGAVFQIDCSEEEGEAPPMSRPRATELHGNCPMVSNSRTGFWYSQLQLNILQQLQEDLVL